MFASKRLLAVLLTATISMGCWCGQSGWANSECFTVQEKDEAQKAGDVPAPHTVAVAGGRIEFSAPGNWQKIEPKVNLIEAEFSIPKAEGDAAAGRLTIMGAGGGVQQNIDRWVGQFTQTDGSDSKDKTKIEKQTIGGQTVHLVDISGTFLDTAGGGQFGPKTEREGYRMLGAVIEAEDIGTYFVKLYGPKKTIDQNSDGFKSMIQSLKLVN